MFRILLAFCLVMTLCHSSSGQGFDINRKMDGSHAGMYNAGRMAELPQGANRLQLWVVVSQNFRGNPLEEKVARWFHSGPLEPDNVRRSPDPRLRKLQAETAYNYYPSNNPLFAESDLIKTVGNATPMVVLTKADGEVIANLGPKTLAKIGTAGECADLLNSGIEVANPVPVFAGQTVLSPLVREAAGLGNQIMEQPCGPDGCTPPAQPAPYAVVPSILPEVVPDGGGASVGALVTGGSLLLSLVLAFLGWKTPGKKP